MIYVLAGLFFLTVLTVVLAYAKGKADAEHATKRESLDAAKKAEEFRADSYADLGKPEFLDWLRHDSEKPDVQLSPTDTPSKPKGRRLRGISGGKKGVRSK